MRKRMMSVLLCTVLAVSLAAPAFAAYRDVPANHWAAEDIQYVTERGLFNGTGVNTFGPSTEMSRAMLATVLYRYAGSPLYPAPLHMGTSLPGRGTRPAWCGPIRTRSSPART